MSAAIQLPSCRIEQVELSVWYAHTSRQAPIDPTASPRKRHSSKQESVEPLDILADKSKFIQLIERDGGTIVQVEDLFSINGSAGGEAIDVTFRLDSFEGIHTIILISDRPSATAKYLTALALEIPCVSRQFVVESIEGVR